MTGSSRWPLHPRPAPGEALSSWLARVADAYGMSLDQLLRHNLGSALSDLSVREVGRLDLDPPAGVLDAVHERTGVPRAGLTVMTIAGWVPWLIDTLDPGDGATTFDTYVRQDSVVLTPGEAVEHNLPPDWRPWLTARPLQRACPQCVTGTTGATAVFTLVSQLPLTLTCPHHGCRLEESLGSPGMLLAWPDDEPVSVLGDPRVVVMDRRTHEALTTGIVTLPGRPVHAAVWFRLLRTLLDEVNTPTSYLRPTARATLQRIWQATGLPTRGGQLRWQPYEALDWATQQAMLHAAAAAIGLIESGEITPRGTLGPTLRDGPHPDVYDGDSPHHHDEPGRASTGWSAAVESLRHVIGIARHDPTTARQLHGMLTSFSRDGDRHTGIRDDIIGMGVPAAFLPGSGEAPDDRRLAGGAGVGVA